MDKRLQIGKEKYDKVHNELLEKGIDLLSQILLIDASLSKLSDLVQVSKTTIYEHFQSSYQKFLSEVLSYSRDKLRTEYLKNFDDNPAKNIVTIYEIWHDEIYKNKLFTINCYAAYILLKDTDLLPKPLIVRDLTEQLTLLEATDDEKEEFLNQFFYSSGEGILADKTALDKKIVKIKSYLDSIKNKI